jgi:hypothetical protein
MLLLKDMSCKIDFGKTPVKWVINKKTLDKDGGKIIDCFYKKNEHAGRFEFELQGGEIVSKLIDFKEGDDSSVETVPGLINFHTHPLDCYKGEKTVWGWPSGDDMREVIRFGLHGNLSHLVFTLEGTYVIQTNPCYLNILKDDKLFIADHIKGDVARGVIVYIIEAYFKSTHGHRTVSYNKEKLEKKGKKICYPQDWVNFANKFKMSNLISKKNICSKALPCNQFPEYSFGSSTIHPLKYLQMYGTEDQFMLRKDGTPLHPSSPKKDLIVDVMTNYFDKVIKLFDSACNKDKHDKFTWEKGQFFKVQLFPNKFSIEKSYVNLNTWIKKMEQKGKTSQNIHNYWLNCKKHTNCIKFDSKNLPYVVFYPLQKTGCKLKKGNQMREWIKGNQIK